MPSRALTRARHLKKPRRRRESGLFLAEGPHVVDEALAVGARIVDVFVTHEAFSRDDVGALAGRAELDGAGLHTVTPRELESIADTRTPQGLVAVVETPKPGAEPLAQPGLWVALDSVQDPGNVGTLLRAAAAFGAVGCVALPGTADPWGRKTVRAGQGAQFLLSIHTADHVDRLREWLDRATVLDPTSAIWAADLTGDSVYESPPVPERLMVVLGSEGQGVSEAVRGLASLCVRVPQTDAVNSLNVAMAGCVVLSWLGRARSGR